MLELVWTQEEELVRISGHDVLDPNALDAIRDHLLGKHHLTGERSDKNAGI